MKPLVLFLVGPTAVGKSKIALSLAKRIGGEIISADSMLVYRGMDIGTAKPSQAEQKKIPHHLIDILPASKPFSAFQYRELALKKIRSILKRKKIPIVTGGSGLYVRALLRGIRPLPPVDKALREKLNREAETSEGAERLARELQKRDPQSADRIDLKNPRRVIRALELSIMKKAHPEAFKEKEISLSDLGYLPLVIGLTRDRDVLYRDIDRRVDQMFRKGLVEEVLSLVKKKISETALQAVGYKEVMGALRGDYGLDKARELVKLNTRHLAKRQWTWFRREEGILWIDLTSEGSLKEALERIVHEVELAKNSI